MNNSFCNVQRSSAIGYFRLKSSEMAIQVLMVYRSDYENEIAWLDKVEATIKQLREADNLRPEEYQEQLDVLMGEYAQLNERTQAIENVNNQGGKYIREAKVSNAWSVTTDNRS